MWGDADPNKPLADADGVAALALLDAVCARETQAGLVFADPARARSLFGADVTGDLKAVTTPASWQARETRRAAARAAGCSYRVALGLRHAPGRVVEERGDFGPARAGGAAIVTFRLVTGDCGAAALAGDQADVAGALAEGRLTLAYQPIVAAGDRRVVRHEGLVRFRETDGRVTPPGARIEAAEQGGLVGALDLSALDLGLAHLAGRGDRALAVNVSAGTIADPSVAGAYLDRVRMNPACARRLTVEITETFALSDLARCADFAAELRACGVRLALDDFGAGYTSFRILKALPLDEVKIDGAFVRGVAARADHAAFVKALIGLAAAMGLHTVAEQVETLEDAAALRDLGVDLLQGYAFGRPALSV